ncbi:hypothetical protein JB92DRAFT_2834051 [Gautieria morchelliformis]|nr:hypothetical protein JB92DRAFT_2834051 [Gautieria morchelliformis]
MKVDEIINSMCDWLFFIDQEDIMDNVKLETVGNSNVTFNKSKREEAAFVFPVKITSNRLFVGPSGTYSGNIGSMEKAKYRMTCCVPENAMLKNVYKRAIHIFRHLQDQISKTNDHHYLLETVDSE